MGVIFKSIFILTPLPVLYCIIPAFVVFGNHYLALRECWHMNHSMPNFVKKEAWKAQDKLILIKTATWMTSSPFQGLLNGSLKVKCSKSPEPKHWHLPLVQGLGIWGTHERDNAATTTTKKKTSHGESNPFYLIFNLSSCYRCNIMWDFLLPDCQNVLKYCLENLLHL